jgi:hypothetical protein
LFPIFFKLYRKELRIVAVVVAAVVVVAADVVVVTVVHMPFGQAISIRQT